MMFIQYVCTLLSIENLALIQSGSIWNCGFSVSFSYHQFKAASLPYPFYIGSCLSIERSWPFFPTELNLKGHVARYYFCKERYGFLNNSILLSTQLTKACMWLQCYRNKASCTPYNTCSLFNLAVFDKMRTWTSEANRKMHEGRPPWKPNGYGGGPVRCSA